MRKNIARLKAIFVLWIYLHGNLNIVDKFVKWGINIDLSVFSIRLPQKLVFIYFANVISLRNPG